VSQPTKLAESRRKKYALQLATIYRNQTTQVSLSVVLALFLVAFFVMVALRPTLATIAGLKKEITESKEVLTILTKKSNDLAQANRVWEKLKPKLPLVETAIPQGGVDYEGLVAAFEVLSAEAEVEFASLTLGEAVLYSANPKLYQGREQEVVEIPITIRVSGPFLSALKFVEKISQMGRLIRVESMTVTSEATSGKEEVAISITGTTAYLADLQVLNKIIPPKEKK